MFYQPNKLRFPFQAILLIVVFFVLTGCSASPATLPAAQAAAAVSTEQPTVVSSAVEPTMTVSVPAVASSTSDAAATEVSFSKDVLPILEDSCVSCHGGEKTSKGLDLKTYASLMAGSQNGAILTAGDASGSKFIQSVQSGKMPKRGPKLTAEQIQLLVNWVNAGASNN